MRRVAFLLLVLTLAACSQDDTKLWKQGDRPDIPPSPVPAAAALPASAEPAPVYSAPRPRPVVQDVLPSQENPPSRYEPPPYEPSMTSRSRLTDSEYRALQGVRQSLDSSIRDLERRSSFDDATAAEERQLRSLKARRQDVLRRLRGG